MGDDIEGLDEGHDLRIFKLRAAGEELAMRIIRGSSNAAPDAVYALIWTVSDGLK